jgi:CheY-like chemotaxis protein
VVDDDPNVCRVIGTVAERYGVDVTTVHDGGEVLDALNHSGPFMIVYLDLLMPHVCGWEVLDLIRHERNNATTPVVILSSAPITPREKEALTDNSTMFMSKTSFKLAQFESLMCELLVRNG